MEVHLFFQQVTLIKTLEEDSQDNKPQMMILVTMLLLVSKQLSVCTQTKNE